MEIFRHPSRGNKEKSRYKTILSEYDANTKTVIANFLNVTINPSKTDAENIEAMIASSKFPEYICMERFLAGKIFLLNDFLQKPKFARLFTNGSYSEPISKLIKLDFPI